MALQKQTHSVAKLKTFERNKKVMRRLKQHEGRAKREMKKKGKSKPTICKSSQRF